MLVTVSLLAPTPSVADGSASKGAAIKEMLLKRMPSLKVHRETARRLSIEVTKAQIEELRSSFDGRLVFSPELSVKAF